MKLTAVLLLAVCLQVQATGYAQKVSISQRNVSLDKVFREIRKQTGYLFFYDVEWLQKAGKVSIDMKNASLPEILDHCLANQPLTYNIVDKTIVLSLKEEKRPIATTNAPVFVDVSGRVTHAITKEPIEGVSVIIKGSQRGTHTDAKGEFTLKSVEPGTTLVFSFVGFVNREVKVDNSGKAIHISLNQDDKNLENVVVIGYGTVQRKDLTGAVSSVTMEDMTKAPVRSFDEALAGRLPGVQVSSAEGQPGSSINIVIRGNNSITQDNSPLYVIDGFPVETPDNSILNPNDIESIDVLKDASATAIYGARGANGVIIITTKKAKEGKPVIRYNGYAGVQQNLKTMDAMSPYEFVKLQQEMKVADINETYLANGVTVEDYKNVPAIDWQDKLYRDAGMTDNSLSISGSIKKTKTKYAATGNLFHQDGIIINSAFKRYQGKLSLDQAIGKKLKVGGYVMYTNTRRYGTIPSSLSGSSMNNLLYSVWGYRPVQPINPSKPINEDFESELGDDLVNATTDYRLNPILIAQNEYRLRNIKNTIANAYVEYNIVKDLKLRVTGGLNQTHQQYDAFNNTKTRSGNPYNIYGVNGSISHYRTTNWLNENTLSYNKKINKDHRISAVAALTLQGNRYKFDGVAANHIPDESMGLKGIPYGEAQRVVPQQSEWSLVSGLSRVNYTLKDRYLFTASFRADGSSKFRKDNRWSYFPSGAFAWRLSNEPFMEKVGFISDAKLRVSWGITGNNRISEYATYAKLDTPITAYYSYDNVLQSGAVLSALASEDLKWENTAQTDVGIDLGLLNNRVNITVDYYKKNTTNLLLNAGLPPTTGYTNAYKNIGKTSNEGIELGLNTINISTSKFTWSTSFNISFNKSKVLALTQNQESITSTMSWDSWYSSVPLYITKIGQPLGQMYGYLWDGVYQYEDFNQLANGTYQLKDNVPTNGNTRASIQPGDVKYRDLNGDLVVNDNDRTVIGRGLPMHFGGFTNNFRYKNFDLNIFFQWSYGNDLVNANRLNFEMGNKVYLNQYASFANRWTPENTNTTMPRAGGQFGYVYSTRVIEDGSYLRLKTAALGYTLPAKVASRLKLKTCRFYLSAQNLITWTNYTGSDPEVAIGYSALTPGFDYSAYPRARTITFGLNLSL